MNTTTVTTDRRQHQLPMQVQVVPFNRQRRERDFGVGYGSSSGYALSKRYTSDWAQPRFRCA